LVAEGRRERFFPNGENVDGLIVLRLVLLQLTAIVNPWLSRYFLNLVPSGIDKVTLQLETLAKDSDRECGF
jgi:hypothetical protein